MTQAPAVAAGALLVDRLLAGGVTDVVLAPGSRSAPLALALASAERAGTLRLHVRVDERSAAFIALGLAKVTGRPTAVACTSGTATANLLPAVVEARYSGVPLVVVTADRPPELRGRGASQTIDQVGMFDQYVLSSRDLPVPGGPDWRERYLAFVDTSVALAARSRGPVHLNAPFRPPLVAPPPPAPTPPLPELVEGPAPPATPGPVAGPAPTPALPGPVAGAVPTPALPELVAGPQANHPTDPTPARHHASTSSANDPLEFGRPDRPELDLPPRTVVIAGDLDVWDAATRTAVARLAESRGWPIVWEASSGLAGAPSAVPHGTLLLADEPTRHRLHADSVLTVGPFGLDRGVLEFVREATRHVAVRPRPRTDPPDPLGTAAQILDRVPTVPGDAVPGYADPDWLPRWRSESAALAAVLGTVDAGAITVADVAAATWASLGPDDLLVVAPSLAIRQVGAFGRGPGPRVTANRGANGIDGLVSTAWGAALAWPGRTVALLGDLAFLHDHNGLLVPDDEPPPDLTVVVADNNGGGIFRTLEQGAPEFASDYDRLFGTPHRRDLVAVARAAGIAAKTVDVSDLATALAEQNQGVRVLVVSVDSSRAEAAWLRNLAAARARSTC